MYMIQGPPPAKKRANFCSQCGGRIEWAVPTGDHCWRHVCSACGFIDYYNPRMVCAIQPALTAALACWTRAAGCADLA